MRDDDRRYGRGGNQRASGVTYYFCSIGCAETLTASVRQALTKAGADDLPLSIEHFVAIPRTRMGKAPLIRIG